MSMKKKIKAKAEVIVPIIILVIPIILVVIALVYTIIDSSKMYIDRDYLDDTDYYNFPKNLDVQFTEITTSDEVYDMLEKECNNFVLKEDMTIILDNNIQVQSEEYVDNNETAETENSNDTLIETGPIYLQDKIFIRYINSNNDMKVASARIYENNEIVTKGIGEIKDILGDNNDIIDSEREYLDEIGSIFKEIINNSSTKISSSTKKKATEYFTEGGYKSIINNTKSLDIKDNEIKIDVIEMGKSSKEISSKDRIIIQFNIEGIPKTIIVKLNGNNKIFDIDII